MVALLQEGWQGASACSLGAGAGAVFGLLLDALEGFTAAVLRVKQLGALVKVLLNDANAGACFARLTTMFCRCAVLRQFLATWGLR